MKSTKAFSFKPELIVALKYNSKIMENLIEIIVPLSKIYVKQLSRRGKDEAVFCQARLINSFIKKQAALPDSFGNDPLMETAAL